MHDLCNLHVSISVQDIVNKTYSGISDNDAIARILKGDTQEFRVLVDRYKNYVFAIVVRILNNNEEAEEAAQDTFIKCFQYLKSFSGDSKFSTWLYRIAFNMAISYKRNQKIVVSSLEGMAYNVASANDTSYGLNLEDQKKAIENGLRKLAPADATVLTLFYLKDCNMEEISKITGLKTNAVKVKLFRARKKLADILINSFSLNMETLL